MREVGRRVEHLDRPLLLETLEALVGEGIASDAYWRLAEEPLEGPPLADLIDAVRGQLVESPLPETEIPALVDLLGIDDAAALMGWMTNFIAGRFINGPFIEVEMGRACKTDVVESVKEASYPLIGADKRVGSVEGEVGLVRLR